MGQYSGENIKVWRLFSVVQNHITKDDPNKTRKQNEEDRKNEDWEPKNFVKSKEPTPDGLEPDECSAQSKKIEAMADCFLKSRLKKRGGFINIVLPSSEDEPVAQPG